MITEEHVARVGKGEYPETVRELAVKWGQIFGVPPSWIVSHAWVESTNHPRAMNPDGPAWGLMQFKLPTAVDVGNLLRKLVKNCRGQAESEDCPPTIDEVARVLKSWRGRGEDLFHPELAVMFGAFYIRHLMRRLGEAGTDQKIVAAAYNQGRGAVMKALRAGKLTPPMKHYLAKIEEAKEKGFA